MPTSYFGRQEPSARRLGSDFGLIAKWAEAVSAVPRTSIPLAQLSSEEQEHLFKQPQRQFRIVPGPDSSPMLQEVEVDFERGVDPEVIALLYSTNYLRALAKASQASDASDLSCDDLSDTDLQSDSDYYSTAPPAARAPFLVGKDLEDAFAAMATKEYRKEKLRILEKRSQRTAAATTAANPRMKTPRLSIREILRDSKILGAKRILEKAGQRTAAATATASPHMKTPRLSIREISHDSEALGAKIVRRYEHSVEKLGVIGHRRPTPANEKEIQEDPIEDSISVNSLRVLINSPRGSGTSENADRSTDSDPNWEEGSYSVSPTMSDSPGIYTPTRDIHGGAPVDGYYDVDGCVDNMEFGTQCVSGGYGQLGNGLDILQSVGRDYYISEQSIHAFQNGGTDASTPSPGTAWDQYTGGASLATALDSYHSIVSQPPPITGLNMLQSLDETQQQVTFAPTKGTLLPLAAEQLWEGMDCFEIPILHPGDTLLPLYWTTHEAKSRYLYYKLTQLKMDDAVRRRSEMTCEVALNPIHVFVDLSNIIISFYDTMKINRGISTQKRVAPPAFNFVHFDEILHRGRKVAKKVVAGSLGGTKKRRPEYMLQAEDLGYEMCIFQRVPKPVSPTLRRKSKGNARDFEQATSGPETSGDDYFAGPMKNGEQGVDELLHLKMLQSAIDTPQRGTIVLATGDAAHAEYSDGFKSNVERALHLGWHVELYGWSRNISSAWRDPTFTQRWGENFRLIELDQFCEELFDATIESLDMSRV
ncbi:hypothetical protein OQA88_8784 [Cercophora sp. LCS_1]